MNTIREFLNDPTKPQSEKERILVNWVFKHLAGQGINSTVHYDGEDLEEWAIPLSHLEQVRKEIFEGMEWTP